MSEALRSILDSADYIEIYRQPQSPDRNIWFVSVQDVEICKRHSSEYYLLQQEVTLKWSKVSIIR